MVCLFGSPRELQASNGATRVHYPHGKRLNLRQLEHFARQFLPGS
jgi:hypothetical protein